MSNKIYGYGHPNRKKNKKAQESHFWFLEFLSIGAFVFIIGLSHWMWVDGIAGQFYGWVFEDTTEYSPSYSDSGFKRIKNGMTVPQVKQVLGEPLEQYSPESYAGMWWRYTKGANNENYRVRAIRIENGKVTEVRGYFYNPTLYELNKNDLLPGLKSNLTYQRIRP